MAAVMESIKKISDTVWEIPTSYKEGMRVPARIYATEKLIREMDAAVYEQITNVATLPGIVNYAFCMPDGHSGYGFPIGGVAAMDAETGVISPGGIGFDINCLSGEARVLHEFGYHRKIAEFDRAWMNEKIKCVNPHTEVRSTEILAFMKESRPGARVLSIVTESGREIVATEDHPFLTPEGMVLLKDLSPGQTVSIYPFEGVPYEPPPALEIVTQEDLRKAYPGHANGFHQIVKVLKKRGLLPLKMDHPRLPYLIKLMGFLQGDGSLQFLKNGGSLLAFYAEPSDLESVRKDIAALGFQASRIYRRHRSHSVKTNYGLVKFARTESCVHSGSTALALLLRCLGATAGDKTRQDFSLPGWLNTAPLWMKRLYLAALFGAELTAPQTVTGHPYNFYGPVLSVNKKQEKAASGRRYLEQIQAWLKEFEIESALLRDREEYVNSKGEISLRLRLQISSQPENLIRLWSLIGFEYNHRKQYLANVAVQYLRLKGLVLKERHASIEAARGLKKGGATLKEIAGEIGSVHVNERFIARSLWEPRRASVRIGKVFPDFWTFLTERTRGLGETGQVWDRIIRKEAVDHKGPVYDFSVRDHAHNFIANSFVVSNCGMRLVLTNLTYDEVKPHLDCLVDRLFQRVPAGVGSSGFIKLTPDEFCEVAEKGARWCVEKGYGWPEDLEYTEEGGCIAGADSSKISRTAIERGLKQIGTLGSGNHYLEVQVAKPEYIFDRRLAQDFGITLPNQVVVMFHCGSRGFGHQVASDYLQLFLQVMEKKYRIKILDRELACAPFNSPEGRDYFAAMKCGINMSFANRQVILHRIREVFSEIFRKSPEELGLRMVYDVAHNTAKLERHRVNGEWRRLLVHRKGATRAFGPDMEGVPEAYKKLGQPVIIGGSMETGSYLLVGVESGGQTFYSTAHGSGRTMSRTKAKKLFEGKKLERDLRERGIYVRSVSYAGLAEEAGGAYKNIDEVIEATELAGISKRVVRFIPIGNVKG